MRQNQTMFNFNDNHELANAWQKFVTARWIAKVIVGIIAIIIMIVLMSQCNTANAQEVERGKTVSADKKKRSTVWIVCIQTDSGKRYSMKWNSHYYGKSANIPSEWDVLTKKNNCVFIKPVV